MWLAFGVAAVRRFLAARIRVHGNGCRIHVSTAVARPYPPGGAIHRPARPVAVAGAQPPLLMPWLERASPAPYHPQLMKLTAARDLTQSPQSEVLGIILFSEDIGPEASLPTAVSPAAAQLVRAALAEQRFKGKAGQSVVVESQGHLPARRIAVVGAGSRAAFGAAEYRHPAAALTRLANGLGATSLFIAADEHSTPPGSVADQGDPAAGVARLEAIAQGAELGRYRFDKYLGPDNRTPTSLQAVTVQAPPSLSPEATATALERGQRIAGAAAYARDLVNEPPGTLTPTALADDVAKRAQGVGVEVKVLGRNECRARGMGMFLAVAQGSTEEPKFIHLAWRPKNARKASKRIVLVGKGVTFDSGGLSLKTTEGMLDMKSDMAGAAAVLSALLLVAEENLPVEVHALAACTENMPSGAAYKLGDVLRSMSGKTVEINNTDAEGRLTLADALTYGLELKPDVIIDFATLTGACVVALGPHTAGVMTNDEAASSAWMAAARGAGEEMWPLPLPARLIEQLKSEIADMRNTGERWGGALTAGLFLKEFVGSTPWIHVDIAGPATTSKEWGSCGKGATGFAVASIFEYVRRLASAGA